MAVYGDVANAKVFARLISFKDLGFEDDDEYTSHVSDLLKTCSRRIDRFCKRPNDYFQAGGVAITEYHDGKAQRDETRFYPLSERKDVYDEWRYTYWTRQTPVVSFTSIKKRTSAIGETEVWTAITGYTSNEATGEVRIKSSQAPSEGTKRLEIIYTAGYSAMPEDVREACEMLAGNYLQARAQEYTTQHIAWGRPSALDIRRPEIFTQDIKDTLESYRKKRAHVA